MSNPIHTYLDLDVVNNNLTGDLAAPALRFEETRNTPFLDGDSSEYFCSIIRFSIQTGNSLPIFIPRIQTGQPDIDLTVYKITLTVFASDAVLYQATATLRHVTSDHTAAIPQEPTTQQDLSGTYYYQDKRISCSGNYAVKCKCACPGAKGCGIGTKGNRA